MGAEQRRDPPEQRFLLFHNGGVEHGDLALHRLFLPPPGLDPKSEAPLSGDKHEIVAPIPR
jgi:hypothetical protein